MSLRGGLLCMLEQAPYNATKAAVIALSETLRSELAPSKIGITAVCPMFFNTPRDFGFDRTRWTLASLIDYQCLLVRGVSEAGMWKVLQTSGHSLPTRVGIYGQP